MRGSTYRILRAYPYLAPVLDVVGPISHLKPSGKALPEAVAEIVAGQMLSGKAAKAIVGRMQEEALASCTNGRISKLSERKLQQCGLSKRKARAITEFSEAYYSEPLRYDEWPSLSFDELSCEVCQFWGLSHWTVEMLAIFHFAQRDIWPANDGTIKRVVERVETIFNSNFDARYAAPERTLLARIFWASMDQGYWD